MDPVILINAAVNYIFGLDNNDIAGYDEFDIRFIYSVIYNFWDIHTNITKHSHLSNEQITYSINLGQHNPNQYHGHKGLRGNEHGQDGKRLAYEYKIIYNTLVLTSDVDAAIIKIINTYDKEICCTYNNFINALYIVTKTKINNAYIDKSKLKQMLNTFRDIYDVKDV